MHIREFVQSDPEKPFLAVIGSPVAQSKSPLIHNFALNYHNLSANYVALDTPADAFAWVGKLLSLKSFRGLNVTIPHKSRIMDILKLIDPLALEAGAVNTVVREQHGLTGYNTDIAGMQLALKEHALLFTGRPAVILGSGGAARAAAASLRSFGVNEALIVSRNPLRLNWPDKINGVSISLINYDRLPEAIEGSGLLINTTPVGMFPDTDACPVSQSVIPLLKRIVVMDAIYNPVETKLLKLAKEAGARAVINGIPMFVGQAAESFRIWTKRTFPVRDATQLLTDSMTQEYES